MEEGRGQQRGGGVWARGVGEGEGGKEVKKRQEGEEEGGGRGGVRVEGV